jgi:hypothetical protein
VPWTCGLGVAALAPEHLDMARLLTSVMVLFFSVLNRKTNASELYHFLLF